MHDQKDGNRLLTIANNDLSKKGYAVPAFTIYDGLAKIDGFLLKGDAIIGLATAQGMIPSKEVLNSKKQTLEGLLADTTTCKKDTVFWAIVSTLKAEILMATRKYDEARNLLQEASRVFTEQGTHPQSSIAVHMLGAVDVISGDFHEALTKFELAATYGAIDIPSFVPASWSVADKLFDRDFEKNLALSAISN